MHFPTPGRAHPRLPGVRLSDRHVPHRSGRLRLRQALQHRRRHGESTAGRLGGSAVVVVEAPEQDAGGEELTALMSGVDALTS